jgi:hypothetical protein
MGWSLTTALWLFVVEDSAPPSAAVGRETVRCVTQPVPNSWFCFDLTDLSLAPSAYSLRHYSSWDNECLRHWVLEGSNDGLSWDALVTHTNDPVCHFFLLFLDPFVNMTDELIVFIAMT